jgi:hypothetical protein
MKNGVKFTICFYEDPAALQEIEFWEGLVKDKILESDRSGKFLNYLLDKDDHYELVCCMPLDTLTNQSISGIANIVKNSLCQITSIKNYLKLKQTWYKVLIFGKIQRNQLRPLERFMGMYNL